MCPGLPSHHRYRYRRRAGSIPGILTGTSEWLLGWPSHTLLASRRHWVEAMLEAVAAGGSSAGEDCQTRGYLGGQQIPGSGLPTGQLPARDQLAGQALPSDRAGLPALTIHRQGAPRSDYQPALGRAAFGRNRRLALQEA